jgi:hypothetical protein
MRKFLAIFTALGLLAAVAPMQASAETTSGPTKTTVVPKAKAKVAIKRHGKHHYVKSTHHKRHYAQKHHKIHYAKHHHRHHLAMNSKARHHASLSHKHLLQTAQQANAR